MRINDKRNKWIDILYDHWSEMQGGFFPQLHTRDYAHWDVVANEGETAFAVISRSIDDNDPIDLALFLVLPEHRGTGVGTAFLRDIAREYGALHGWCHTEAQAAFYEKAGCSVLPDRWRKSFSFYLTPIVQRLRDAP